MDKTPSVFERHPLLTSALVIVFFLVVLELLMHLLFFLHCLPPNPIYMTSLEKKNQPVLGKNIESKIIVYEDNVPHRGKGPANYMQTGIPIHDVYFDEKGMKIDQYDGPADNIIGVFGDSFTSAEQVGQYEDFSALTETALRAAGKRVNVKNFGMDGMGTAGEYLRYRQLKEKGEKFDHVVVVMYLNNDINNNHRELNGPYENFPKYPYFKLENGQLVRDDHVSQVYEREGIKDFLRDYSHIASTINNVRQVFKIKAHPFVPKENLNSWAGVTVPPKDKTWEDAWAITEAILKKWHEDCVKSDEKMVLVFLSEFWDGAVYHTGRMMGFAEKNHIDYINFAPIARDYIKEHDIKDPYFQWEHDGHYNQLGHQVLSQSLITYFKKEL
jgi:hypothetical protein